MDPAACQALTDEPRLPDGASIPGPVSEAERAATAAFLNWVAEVLDWGRTATERGRLAQKEVCHGR